MSLRTKPKKSTKKIGRGKRHPLLSDMDREIIKGKLKPNDLYDFTYDLEKKIYELLDDLKLIKNDPYGVTNELKSRIGFNIVYKKENWIAELALNEIISVDFSGELYINKFRRYKKNKNYLYWLNLVSDSAVFKKGKSNYHIHQKAQYPKYMFEKLTSVKNNEDWLKRDGAILLECYMKIKELLPTTREDAKSINELKKYLAEPDKYLEWNREQNKMTLSEFKKENPLAYNNWVNEKKFLKFVEKKFKRIQLQNKKKLEKFNKKEILKLKNELMNKFNEIIPEHEIDKMFEKFLNN